MNKVFFLLLAMLVMSPHKQIHSDKIIRWHYIDQTCTPHLMSNINQYQAIAAYLKSKGSFLDGLIGRKPSDVWGRAYLDIDESYKVACKLKAYCEDAEVSVVTHYDNGETIHIVIIMPKQNKLTTAKNIECLNESSTPNEISSVTTSFQHINLAKL